MVSYFILCYGLHLLISCYPISVQSNLFKIMKFERTNVEESRINDIKTIQIGKNGLAGFLKCTDECYSMNINNFPNCSSVQYDEDNKTCALSYVHKSSKPLRWNAPSNGSVSTRKQILLSGSEISSIYVFCQFNQIDPRNTQK